MAQPAAQPDTTIRAALTGTPIMGLPSIPSIEGLPDAIHQLILELHKQHRKWGEQDHPDDLWAAIVAEELSEAVEVMGDEFVDPVPLAWMVTGMSAIRILERCLGRDAPSSRSLQEIADPDAMLRCELIQAAAVLLQWAACVQRRVTGNRSQVTGNDDTANGSDSAPADEKIPTRGNARGDCRS